MKKVLSICLSVLALYGCSKNSESPSITGATPFSTYVASSSFIKNHPSTEFSGSIGYEFKTTSDGNVTGLGLASAATGNFVLQLYKVDSVNNTGTLVASQNITFAANDTAGFKFKYVYLSSKVAISKGVYYRVSAMGNFVPHYEYLTIPYGTTWPIISSDPRFKFTKGVYGVTYPYPDTSFKAWIFPADVVVQFP